jgi:hypothetical protein
MHVSCRRAGGQTALFSLTLEAGEAECQVTKGAHEWSWANDVQAIVLMAMGKTSNSCGSAITIPEKKFKRGSTGKSLTTSREDLIPNDENDD